jgi:hypothetical protein
MAESFDIPSLERVVFFTGQRLTAADLAALQRAHRELRWLHNRSLHNWGIGIGFGVTGERGDSAVTVAPGYGIDCLGREIILTEPRTLAVPAVASAPGGGEATFYLTAVYLPDENQNVAERRPGACLPEGTVRLTEGPGLEWRQADELHEGRELILAQAWIQNCRLSRALSLSARRNAKPSQQPYIAAGQTKVGDTSWSVWTEDGEMLGYEVTVDTSDARFRGTPRYVAHLAGDRFLAADPGPLAAVALAGIVDATPIRFTLQALLPPNLGGSINPSTTLLDETQGLDIVRTQLKWHVVWMGIEG